MNTATKTFLVITLVAIAVVVLLFGGGLMPGHLLGARAIGSDVSSGAGLGEFGGYLILLLVNAGLGTVVAWMLFGKRK